MNSAQSFFEKLKKTVDRNVSESLLGTLSPSGRLFEIYFVRLIGTPNQNSKYASAALVANAVVHESLGS
jgi:hypothetical protein